MIVLKVAQTDEGLAILLSPEAQELLGATIGGEIGLQVSEAGELVLGVQDMAFEARRERGRAFLNRYAKTFAELAK